MTPTCCSSARTPTKTGAQSLFPGNQLHLLQCSPRVQLRPGRIRLHHNRDHEGRFPNKGALGGHLGQPGDYFRIADRHKVPGLGVAGTGRPPAGAENLPHHRVLERHQAYTALRSAGCEYTRKLPCFPPGLPAIGLNLLALWHGLGRLGSKPIDTHGPASSRLVKGRKFAV